MDIVEIFACVGLFIGAISFGYIMRLATHHPEEKQ